MIITFRDWLPQGVPVITQWVKSVGEDMGSIPGWLPQGVPVVTQWVKSVGEDMGSIPGFDQWVKDLALL